MCEFCDTNYKKPLLETDDEEGQSLTIENRYGYKYLYLKLYGQLENLELDYDIDYCPMCGRKLGDCKK